MELIVSTATLSSGGAERVLSVLSPYLTHEFESVTYILWKQSEIFYELDKNVKIIDLEELLGSTSNSKKIKWFRKYIRMRPQSIILSFLYPYNMRVLISTLGLKNKIIIAERRDGSKVKGGKVVRFIRNILYRNANKIIMQTQSNIKNYPKYLFNKINIIPNPIRFDFHNLGLSINLAHDNSIVTVGRLIEEKNHKFLIETFYEFLKIRPEFTLTIFGEGILRKELESLIEKLELKDKVFLPGNVKNIEEHICNADIFVLSSKSEGMPNALFEAMALGLPCISTKVNGAVDYIKNGENGLLIDQCDKKGLLEALLTLSNDRALADNIAKNATNIFYKLDAQKICDNWTQILKN